MEATTTNRSPRILIVEDDSATSATLQQFLSEQGYLADVESNGQRAAQEILRESPEAVVLSMQVAGKDGLEICREVRPAYVGPIIMTAAENDDLNEIISLEVGASDFMTKPLRLRVLLARIRARMRAFSTEPADAANEVTVGGIRMDLRSRVFEVEGETVELTSSEFDLMWLLVNEPDRVHSRRELFKTLRGITYDGTDRSIDLQISRLRRKLEDRRQNPALIRSIRGIGYQLAVDA
ncbi:MAG: winged helix-turn-helix domain-containing protein [Fuerstiella sp.]